MLRNHLSRAWTVRVVQVVMLLVCAAPAVAETIVQPDGLLLPEVGYIVNRDTVTFATPGGLVTLSSLVVDSPSARVTPPFGGGAVPSFFDVFVDVSLDGVSGSPFTDSAAPASVNYAWHFSGGPITEFVTEMLSLDISGGSLPAGVKLRESPTLVTGGGVTMTDIGGGAYAVDSYFDVFFEITRDDGIIWTPASGPIRITTEVPEPATLSLLALGSLVLVRRLRRTR